ncbi:MAG: DUF4331 family protein, partial [Cyclobacteriaceae bacterium]|nr:DUF4331 family protein [Cyclobacteriaceae bacterium HetDA_MAG_MS6]
MKKLILGTALIAAAATIAIFAADHIDAPAVGTLDDGSSVDDITDFYAFESPENSDNYVFVANVLGLTAPSATGNVAFDENVMYEFNIDTDGDNIENQVIQVIFRDGKVISFGPTAPTQTGLA